MFKNPLFILMVIGLITFGNTLQQGFVGDDEFLIEQNAFYKSWHNVPLLFSENYTSPAHQYYSGKGQYMSSGAVAYRPAGVFFYFLDYSLWKLNPFGYHLTNLIFHLLNTCLVFALIRVVSANPVMAFWGAVFFSVHPLKAEPVSAIGFRHDLIAAFFSLTTLLCYIRSRTKDGYARIFYFVLSMLAMSLGFFSKESAVVLPVLLVVYDFYYSTHRPHSFKEQAASYAAMAAILAFYLYVYIVVFPNTSYAHNPFVLKEIVLSVPQSIFILGHYILWLIFPFNITPLPVLYMPPWDGTLVVKMAAFLTALGGAVWLVVQNKKPKEVLFFLIWFFVALIPVSNIIPTANPIAHRFVYLPSIGAAAIFGYLVYRLSQFRQNRTGFDLTKISKAAAVGFILVCMISTHLLNRLWYSNISLMTAMVRNFPDHHKAWSVLGILYNRLGLEQEAEGFFIKSAALHASDPQVYYYLGKYNLVKDPARAKEYFEQTVAMNAHYSSAWAQLAKLSMQKGDMAGAFQYINNSEEAGPNFLTYETMISFFKQSGNEPGACQAFKRAQKNLSIKDTQDLLLQFDMEPCLNS